MRRWLSILLLLVLPFQFSWAAAASYCEHESGTRAQHFGHHDHKHQQPAGESGETSKVKAGGAVDIADCHFHCPCSAALPASIGLPVVAGAGLSMDWVQSDSLAPVLARPERPQWVDHA